MRFTEASQSESGLDTNVLIFCSQEETQGRLRFRSVRGQFRQGGDAVAIQVANRLRDSRTIRVARCG